MSNLPNNNADSAGGGRIELEIHAATPGKSAETPGAVDGGCGCGCGSPSSSAAAEEDAPAAPTAQIAAGQSCGCHSSHAPGDGDEEHDYAYLAEKKRYAARIRRIEGQVRGIGRMIDEEQYCIDVLTQISAVNSALRSLALTLLDAHLHHCVLHAAQAGEDELDAKLVEASVAIARLAK